MLKRKHRKVAKKKHDIYPFNSVCQSFVMFMHQLEVFKIQIPIL